MIRHCFLRSYLPLRGSAAALAAAVALAAAATPRVPSDDAEVLERLPRRAGDPAMIEVRALRARLTATPRDAEVAARLAQRYFELASAEGDPRYVGYAEAALRVWPGDDAPADILFMRGLLRQYRHDFEGALQDLERALRQDPEHVGARSWRAAIFMVQARYGDAARECAALAGMSEELLATGCSAYVEATTGRASEAYRRLAAALERHADADTPTRLWVLTRLAEIAERLGDAARAERHFRDALALGIEDNFLLAAYADFLIDRRRPREVLSLLKGRERSDTLLLRLALAEKALGLASAARRTQALGERFAAAALRGERLHLAEESRYQLELRGDARSALEAAVDNWRTQREPRDARVLLDAALAAGDREAARPALQWLEQTGFEDSRLRSVAARLK